jgi:hypothetical protein
MAAVILTVAGHRPYYAGNGQRLEQGTIVPCCPYERRTVRLKEARRGRLTIGHLRTDLCAQANVRRDRLVLVCESSLGLRAAPPAAQPARDATDDAVGAALFSF